MTTRSLTVRERLRNRKWGLVRQLASKREHRSTVAAAVLTPSTDPFTQALLALPLVGLYFGGAGMVTLYEKSQGKGPLAGDGSG